MSEATLAAGPTTPLVGNNTHVNDDVAANNDKATAAKSSETTTIGELKKIVDSSDLPQPIKDDVNASLDEAAKQESSLLKSFDGEFSPEAQAELESLIEEIVRNVLKDSSEEADEAAKSGKGGAEGGSNAGKGGGANWLSVLASAMGEVAGRHLENAVNAGSKIAGLEDIKGEGKEADIARANQAKQMTALQAEMQADTQMFKIAQEGVTTITKTTGEALSSTARKQ